MVSEPEVNGTGRITLAQVKANPKVVALITGANEVMKAMGYTEHGFRHVGVVSTITRYILERLGVEGREAELGQIAGYLHDIGNSVNRRDHPTIGAGLAYNILTEMGMPIEEIIPILAAIGNHEESAGQPVSKMSAALIIADKSDVHFSRVQETDPEQFDIHDKVNNAVQKSRIEMDDLTKVITLVLEIDTDQATVMEYFEIFLSRMVMCRKASSLFGYRFRLIANGTRLE